MSPGLHNQNQSGPLARFKSKARGKGHILQDKKSLGEQMYIKMMCIPQNYINEFLQSTKKRAARSSPSPNTRPPLITPHPHHSQDHSGRHLRMIFLSCLQDLSCPLSWGRLSTSPAGLLLWLARSPSEAVTLPCSLCTPVPGTCPLLPDLHSLRTISLWTYFPSQPHP